MARTLSEEDIDAIAVRVVQVIGTRLSGPEPIRDASPLISKPEPAKTPAPKLAFSLTELAAELGVSKVSIYRLESRGLLKSVPHLRTKIYPRQEVEKFLNWRAGENR